MSGAELTKQPCLKAITLKKSSSSSLSVTCLPSHRRFFSLAPLFPPHFHFPFSHLLLSAQGSVVMMRCSHCLSCCTPKCCASSCVHIPDTSVCVCYYHEADSPLHCCVFSSLSLFLSLAVACMGTAVTIPARVCVCVCVFCGNVGGWVVSSSQENILTNERKRDRRGEMREREWLKERKARSKEKARLWMREREKMAWVKERLMREEGGDPWRSFG